MARTQTKPIPTLTPERIEKFWSRVRTGAPHECWPWTRGHDEDGYGLCTFRTADANEKTYRTHRLAYFLTFGDPGERLVLHRATTRHAATRVTSLLATTS